MSCGALQLFNGTILSLKGLKFLVQKDTFNYFDLEINYFDSWPFTPDPFQESKKELTTLQKHCQSLPAVWKMQNSRALKEKENKRSSKIHKKENYKSVPAVSFNKNKSPAA